VLRGWAQVVDDWHRLTGDDRPLFAYNEQALLSGIAGSIWRGTNDPRDLVLEEYVVSVRDDKRRVDMWADLYDSHPGATHDVTFLVEAKRLVASTLPVQDRTLWWDAERLLFIGRPATPRRAGELAAVVQLREYPREAATHKVALLFGQPRAPRTDPRSWSALRAWAVDAAPNTPGLPYLRLDHYPAWAADRRYAGKYRHLGVSVFLIPVPSSGDVLTAP